MGLELHAKVGIDGSGFAAGLNKMEHAATHFKDHLTGSLKGLALEAFGIYGIEQAFKKTIESAEQLIDTSRRLGIGVEALQEFGYAAKQSGSDLETMTAFIEKLNASRIDPKKLEFFEKLGISKGDLRSLKVEDLIMKLSANMQGRSSQELDGPLLKIGGKGAGKEMAFLKENLAEMREEAHKLGVVMKTEDAVMLKFIADEMTILSKLMVSNLAPAISYVADVALGFINILKSTASFWGDFSGRIKGKDWVTLVFAPFMDTKDPKVKESWERVSAAIKHAGPESENELNDANAQWDEQKKKLLKKQKDIEGINSVPDFGSVMGGGPKAHHVKEYSDSLTRVGNFLGGSKGSMANIATQHLAVSRQIHAAVRQIANNTSTARTFRFSQQGAMDQSTNYAAH